MNEHHGTVSRLFANVHAVVPIVSALAIALGGASAATAAGTDRYVDSPSPKDAAVDREWVWLAEQVGWSDSGALRRRLPDVSAADIVWTRVAMHVDREVLTHPGLTADAMLGDSAHQTVRKAAAAATAMPFVALVQGAMPKETLLAINPSDDPSLRALDRALNDTYSDRLEHLASLREATDAGTSLFLWVDYALRMDRDAHERLRVSAHDLVHMADYQLARKLAADAHVESLVECVRCAEPSAPYYADACRTRDRQWCAGPATEAAYMDCAAYLKNMVHPAAQVAHCSSLPTPDTLPEY